MKPNIKISRKVPCHGTVRIALESSPSLESITKTFITLLFPVVLQTLITMLHQRWKKSTKNKRIVKKVSLNDPNIENLISCDYYDISEIMKMKIREQQDLSILHLQVISATKRYLLKMCHLGYKLRIFLFQRKVVPFSRYSSFCIFNHPLIYQICEVMMSISTWNGRFLNISFEPQLINPPNLDNW